MFGDLAFSEPFIQIKDAFDLGMTSVANTGVSTQSVHFSDLLRLVSILIFV